jgi:bacterioferritin
MDSSSTKGAVDNARIIDKLNEIIRWEWTGVAQYAQHSFIVKGPWRQVYAEFFRDGAEESFEHARKIGDKIVALGGVPSVERVPIRQSESLIELLQFGLDFERGAVKLYNEALALSVDDRPLTVLLEDIILEEQEGVDELEKLLHNAESVVALAEQGIKAG